VRRNPMAYSIFSETMADMRYPEIERAAKEKWPVLFPIAVIEEHGPHMCLATDAYLTYHLCKMVKRNLKDFGIESLIAPPYYWGINVATNGFSGSFTVKPETMVLLLFDLISCLKSWGFEKIFLMNVHGDLNHIISIIQVARKAYEEFGEGVYYIVPDIFIKRVGLSGEETFIISQSTPKEPLPQYFDLHAGGSETSLMIKNFPELVDIDLARSLESSRTTLEGLNIWRLGGEKAKEITPLGYCGNPSAIDLEKAKISENRTIEELTRLILRKLKGE